MLSNLLDVTSEIRRWFIVQVLSKLKVGRLHEEVSEIENINLEKNKKNIQKYFRIKIVHEM